MAIKAPQKGACNLKLTPVFVRRLLRNQNRIAEKLDMILITVTIVAPSIIPHPGPLFSLHPVEGAFRFVRHYDF
jgi:hypothetical protein